MHSFRAAALEWVKTGVYHHQGGAEVKDVKEKAAKVWQGMDKNEKTGVRFGMFPQAKMKAAEAEGYDGHKLVCALMDQAQADGGMRA